MIDDYKLLQNFETLLNVKNFIVWGVGEKGKELGKNIYEYTKKVCFVDSDKTKQGEYCGIPVYSPEEFIEPEGEYAFVLSTDNLKVQESILEQIELMGIQSAEIYTWYAMQSVLAFMKNRDNLCNKSNIEVILDRLEAKVDEISYAQIMQEQLFLASVTENPVFIYQSKKVGSVSVVNSARAAGIYGVHIHDFSFSKSRTYFLRDMIRKVSGKIISIVREPIARQVSLLWHSWGKFGGDFIIENKYKSLEEIEHQFYNIPNREDEFEWYLKEFKNILDINIYEYPFDKEKGYSIIEKDGISLLLMKTERLNDLESVIGKFLGVEKFKLAEGNMAQNKKYKIAYQNYLQNVRIPQAFYNYYYCNNQYMDHFYTKEEKDVFYQKWKDHILDERV